MNRKLLLLAALLSSVALASVGVLSGASRTAQAWFINTYGAGEVVIGRSMRTTYLAGATGLTTTSAYALGMNAEASRGFHVQRICVGTSSATAAALQTVIIRRVTTAPSGGTTVTAEGTAALGVSAYLPGAAAWSGLTLATPTSGAAGAFIDGWGITVGELGAGAADPPSSPENCHTYGEGGTQMPYVAAGTTNGIYVLVSSVGAGGLAAGSISILFIAE